MMRPTARLIEEKKPSEATHQRSPAESRRRSPPKAVPVRSQLAGDRLSGSSVFGHRADVAKIAGCELSIKPQGRGRSGREKSGRKSGSFPPCRTEVHSITVGSSSLFNRAPTGEAPITVIIGGRALLTLIAARFSGPGSGKDLLSRAISLIASGLLPFSSLPIPVPPDSYRGRDRPACRIPCARRGMAHRVPPQ